jgi:hypothetical protein
MGGGGGVAKVWARTNFWEDFQTLHGILRPIAFRRLHRLFVLCTNFGWYVHESVIVVGKYAYEKFS